MASAQTKEARLNVTKDEILARAKQEGKLSLVPGYDKNTIAPLVAAFKKKYPFIDVSWQMVTGIAASQRQLFELAGAKPLSMSSAPARRSLTRTSSRT